MRTAVAGRMARVAGCARRLGAIRSSLVTASSGHEILDNQALDMVHKAKPLTPIPAALRGREFAVDIPVIFDLQAG